MKRYLIPLIIILFFTSTISHMVIGYETDTIQEIVVEVEPEFTVTSGPMDSPWPMMGHDVRRTGRSPYNSSNNPGTEKWRYMTPDSYIEGSSVIDDNGNIYFGSWWRNTYAINPNGTKKWIYETGSTMSVPALADDRSLYMGSWDDNLYALNLDGTLKWIFNAKATIGSSSPAISDNGTIYFGTYGEFGRNSKLYAVNPDGSEKWNYTVRSAINTAPAIGNEGVIYFGAYDQYIYAIKPNGTLYWEYKTGGSHPEGPVIADDGTVYVSSGGKLYSFYPNGTKKWIINAYGYPAIGYDGTIYLGSNDFKAVNTDGSIKWIFKFDDGDYCVTPPAISADGIIYFGIDIIASSHGGELIALNLDGTERWRKLLVKKPGFVDRTGGPCIGKDGTVYIGASYDKRIYGNSWEGHGYLHAFGLIESNEPPEIPTITGPSSGKVLESIDYWITANDPDINPVYFYIKWGDGTNSGWIGPFASGEEVTVGHTWLIRGNYTIRAKAKDTVGGESNWAYLEVSVPKSRTYLGLLERFPLLQKILDVVRLNSR